MAARVEEPTYFMGDDERKYTTFVAIDIGTTFSGFAFAVGRDSKIFDDGQKVPTAMLLSKEKTLVAFGKEALDKYCELEPAERKEFFFLDRFKMELHNDRDVNRSMRVRAVNGETISVEKAFSRAIEFFYNKAKEDIVKSIGARLREDEVKWVLTVPAIWGTRAKELMMSAARQAGIPPDNIAISLEPEAAIFASFSDLHHVHAERGRPEKLRVMVVDCGGGTVDVKVQDIVMAREEYEDVVVADGGPWGGTVVDKNIRRKLSEFIGEEIAGSIDDLEWLKFERQVIEEAKRTVGSQYSNKVVFRLSPAMADAIGQAGGDLNQSAEAGRESGIRYRRRLNNFLMEKNVMESCFDDSIRSIANHIEGILRQDLGIHCILLVGGFADSPILLHRIEQRFNSDSCRVIHPTNSTLAVVRGAVLHGQKPDRVRSRMSRYTYGVRANTDFIEGEDPEERKVVIDGDVQCVDVFTVFVPKGKAVPAGSQIEHKFSPASPDQTVMKVVLYRSPRADVKFIDEPDCEKLGSVRVFSPNVEQGTNRRLSVKVDFSDTTLRFQATDMSSGKMETKRVQFDCL